MPQINIIELTFSDHKFTGHSNYTNHMYLKHQIKLESFKQTGLDDPDTGYLVDIINALVNKKQRLFC